MQDLDAIQAALIQLRSGEIGVAAFSQQTRAHDVVLTGLPERYRLVLHDLLDRLESSALFTEESCSFSQSGLLDNLQLWLDKARAQLVRG